MKARVRCWRVARMIGLVLVPATSVQCSHDYDRFDLSGAGGSGQGGSGTGGGSATGGISTGGSSGRAGASGAGAGGSPTDGSAGRPADGGCGAGEKLCAAACVLDSDPRFGCAQPSCDPCSTANGTASCSAGICAITCTAGFADCNTSATDGCEQATTGNALHCGECGRTCSGTNASARVCASGNTCTSSCKLGFGNCNRPATGADDGCEQDTSASDANCGGCGNDCSQQGASGNGLTCAAGRCGCSADAQCQTNAGAGTVTCNTTTRNCVCGGTECKAGEACRRQGNNQECGCNGGGGCGANAVCCRTAVAPGCKNLMTDVAHCGACGRACVTGFICTNGECACNAAADCNGGSPGQCNAGVCSCGAGADAGAATTCAPGERCLSDSSCG